MKYHADDEVGTCATCGKEIVWPAWAPAHLTKVCCVCLAPHLRDRVKEVEAPPPPAGDIFDEEEWAI